MAIEMTTTRVYYDLSTRTEYPAGAKITVVDEREAERLERRRKAVRTTGANPTDLPTPKNPTDLPPKVPEPKSSLASLRAEYKGVVGKLPGPKWDEDTIRARMAEYRTGALSAGE